MPPIYANGHISATGDPINFMFGSTVGFSGMADLMALVLRFEQIQDGGHRHVGKISNGHISLQPVIRSTSCLVIRWGFRGQRI